MILIHLRSLLFLFGFRRSWAAGLVGAWLGTRGFSPCPSQFTTPIGLRRPAAARFLPLRLQLQAVFTSAGNKQVASGHLDLQCLPHPHHLPFPRSASAIAASAAAHPFLPLLLPLHCTTLAAPGRRSHCHHRPRPGSSQGSHFD